MFLFTREHEEVNPIFSALSAKYHDKMRFFIVSFGSIGKQKNGQDGPFVFPEKTKTVKKIKKDLGFSEVPAVMIVRARRSVTKTMDPSSDPPLYPPVPENLLHFDHADLD